MTTEEKMQLLGDLWEEWHRCTRCGLCSPVGRARNHVVFGSGNPDAKLMIIGEAPGEQEDANGEPFWQDAPAGDLLCRFLSSFDKTRDDVFITNVAGCRPTRDDDPQKNRPPSDEEIEACRPRLHRIIEIVDPYVLLLLGETAMRALTRDRRTITAVAKDPDLPAIPAYTRGICLEVERPAVVTFHPAYLTRKATDMTKGSDAHLAYQAFEKAFALVDAYEHLYFGVPLPTSETR